MIDSNQLPAGLAELKTRFEKMVGFNVTVVPNPADPNRVKLAVQAPFGQLLGSIDVTHYEGVWKFGGSTGFMPSSWDGLCQLQVADT